MAKVEKACISPHNKRTEMLFHSNRYLYKTAQKSAEPKTIRFDFAYYRMGWPCFMHEKLKVILTIITSIKSVNNRNGCCVVSSSHRFVPGSSNKKYGKCTYLNDNRLYTFIFNIYLIDELYLFGNVWSDKKNPNISTKSHNIPKQPRKQTERYTQRFTKAKNKTKNRLHSWT